MDKEIKIALVSKGKTLQHLADECGVSRALISMILNDKHKGYRHRPKIRRALGLRVSALPGPEKGRAA